MKSRPIKNRQSENWHYYYITKHGTDDIYRTKGKIKQGAKAINLSADWSLNGIVYNVSNWTERSPELLKEKNII